MEGKTMTLKKLLAYLIFLVIFSFGLSACGGGGGGSSNHSSSKPAVKNWTVAVYMDGDNSLSGEVEDDMLEMEDVGSDEYINVVAEVDTLSAPIKRYFIEQGNARLIQTLGELDMAEPETLSDFANWVVQNYPAKHYLLVLWNHGGGFKYKSLYEARDIFEDNHSDNSSKVSIMSIPKLSTALNNIKNTLSKKIDIVGFDDCLMSMLEVAYEIKDTSDFMVGSENTEPFSGWPYNYILFDLASNPSMSAKELSQTIVKEYVDSYMGYDGITQSAIELDKIDNLSKQLNDLADLLITAVDNQTVKNELQTAIFNSVQRFDDNGDGSIDSNDSYTDLNNLCEKIKQRFPDYAACAKNVTDALKGAVVANGYAGDDMAGAKGLSIWYPNPFAYNKSEWLYYWNHYEALSFSKNNNWDEFIYKLWQ